MKSRDSLGACLPYVCEIYRYAKGLSGYNLAELFDKYEIWDYVNIHKKRLIHLSNREIVAELDDVLEEEGVYLETQQPV